MHNASRRRVLEHRKGQKLRLFLFSRDELQSALWRWGLQRYPVGLEHSTRPKDKENSNHDLLLLCANVSTITACVIIPRF